MEGVVGGCGRMTDDDLRLNGCRGLCPVTPDKIRWDPAEFIRRSRDAGLDDEAIADEATSHYWLADLGGVFKAGGFLWDRCPASYIEHADESTMAEALRAIRLHREIDMGITPTGPLTVGVWRLLLFVRAQINTLDEIRREQRREESRREARRNRGNRR